MAKKVNKTQDEQYKFEDLRDYVYTSTKEWFDKLAETRDELKKDIAEIQKDILDLQPTRNPYVSDINREVLELLQHNRQLMLKILRNHEEVNHRLEEIDKNIDILFSGEKNESKA